MREKSRGLKMGNTQTSLLKPAVKRFEECDLEISLSLCPQLIK